MTLYEYCIGVRPSFLKQNLSLFTYLFLFSGFRLLK